MDRYIYQEKPTASLLEERYWGVWFILVVNSINYYLTYSRISFDAYFLATYAIDTLQGLITWYACRWVIFSLDRYIPYEQYFFKRLVVQLLLTTVVAISLITGLTVLTNVLFSNEPIPSGFFTYNLVIFFIWVIVLNGIYISYHYINLYKKVKETPPITATDASSTEPTLTCRVGRQKVIIPYSQVSSVCISDDVVLVQDRQGKTSYIDKSIQELEQLFDGKLYRANRQYLISKENVASYSALDYGKLQVNLNHAVNGQPSIIISRTKAADFKKWLS